MGRVNVNGPTLPSFQVATAVRLHDPTGPTACIAEVMPTGGSTVRSWVLSLEIVRVATPLMSRVAPAASTPSTVRVSSPLSERLKATGAGAPALALAGAAPRAPGAFFVSLQSMRGVLSVGEMAIQWLVGVPGSTTMPTAPPGEP